MTGILPPLLAAMDGPNQEIYTVGQPFGGGYYAGRISMTANGIATHYLVVSPRSSGNKNRLKWQTTLTNTPGTSSTIDGWNNTRVMNDSSHPAAQFCRTLTIGGYTDWYLPARYELDVLYWNFKPTNTLNALNTSYVTEPMIIGVNPYAVPKNHLGLYSTTVPGQTSATDFQSPYGSEMFTTQTYWSSTQLSDFSAIGHSFGTGNVNGVIKDNTAYVRAIRRIPV